MTRESLGDTFLRKLYEMTVNNGTEIVDMYEIGKEIDKWLAVNLLYDSSN